jgi:ATP-binding cassette subfamily F protein 3
VHIYPGNYEEYLWRKGGGPEKTTVSLSQGLKATPAPVMAPPPPPEPVKVAAVSSVKRLNPIKLKQIEDRLAAVEAELPAVESGIAVAEEQMGSFTSAAESQRLAEELDGLRERRAALLAEWEELSLALEEQSSAV